LPFLIVIFTQHKPSRSSHLNWHWPLLRHWMTRIHIKEVLLTSMHLSGIN